MLFLTVTPVMDAVSFVTSVRSRLG